MAGVLMVVGLLVLVGCAVHFFPRDESAFLNPEPAIVPQTPLGQQLWRQSWTPKIGSPQGSSLLPIFAFDLYPQPMREVYDYSRELDTAMLRVLVAEPEDEDRQRHLKTLQQITRGVRRQLIELLIQSPDDVVEDTLEPLRRRLDLVADMVERLELETEPHAIGIRFRFLSLESPRS